MHAVWQRAQELLAFIALVVDHRTIFVTTDTSIFATMRNTKGRCKFLSMISLIAAKRQKSCASAQASPPLPPPRPRARPAAARGRAVGDRLDAGTHLVEIGLARPPHPAALRAA